MVQGQRQGDSVNSPLVLDPCCGSRMMWFDKADARALFGDLRSEVLTVTDNSRGNASGQRTLHIEPDTLMDFRDMPFDDWSFKLVAFDPPHLVQAGPRSWLAAKYGKLSENWRADLTAGFSECFRVLEADGVLVFKWNETQVKLKDVLALTPHKPLFGQVSGRSGMTHWLVFMKPDEPLPPVQLTAPAVLDPDAHQVAVDYSKLSANGKRHAKAMIAGLVRLEQGGGHADQT